MPSESFERLLVKMEKLHPKLIDLSLERLLKLLNKLDNPHLKLPKIIHIAGTNGKGSTLSFIKQILIENNMKVHCYTSPHLEKIEERFILSNKIITKKKLFEALQYIESINDNNPITFFEITTATAFYLFSRSKADYLILETGLGGRFDATNVIKDSLINIITPISFDHTEYLGNTLKKITNEKLGIIKKSSTIIIGKQEKEIKKYIEKKLQKNKNKKIFFNKNVEIKNIKNKTFSIKINNKNINFKKPSLLGQHQIENASIAIAAVLELKKIDKKIKINKFNKALISTTWPGRLERINIKKKVFYLDGAHNISGALQLVDFLKKENKNTWLILGMLNNKNIKDFLYIIKNHINGVVATEIPKEKNSFTIKEIFKACSELDIKCVKKKKFIDAKNYLLNKINSDIVLVTGSLYLIGKIRKFLI